ncbi:hypothetical protein ACOMHN_028781 [Nucella lapillus]
MKDLEHSSKYIEDVFSDTQIQNQKENKIRHKDSVKAPAAGNVQTVQHRSSAPTSVVIHRYLHPSDHQARYVQQAQQDSWFTSTALILAPRIGMLDKVLFIAQTHLELPARRLSYSCLYSTIHWSN